MIDLTKPIRRRINKKEIYDPKTWTYVRFDEGNGRYTQMLQDEFERVYENIPEPRRPREWVVFVLENGAITQAMRFGEDAKTIRVIEWPADAPLPEWPE